MKRLLLIGLVLFAGRLSPVPVSAQTAADLNEGVRITVDATTGAQVLTWWGRTGRTYFVQQSFDLVTWTYVPVIRDGAAAVDGLNFACTDPRQFWRLRHTDAATGGLAAADADFDGDGVSNMDELNALIDPFNRDTDGDHYSDGVETAYLSDPASSGSIPSLGADAPEEDGYERPVTLWGYSKTVNNDWSKSKPPNQPETASGYVSWFDSAGHSGTLSYHDYEPRWSQKYELLSYPDPPAGLNNYGSLKLASALGRELEGTIPSLGEVFAHADLGHYQVLLANGDGLPQPWPVYRKLLTYKTRRPWNGGPRTYSEIKFEKFYIEQGGYLSPKRLRLEPPVEMGWQNDEVIEFVSLNMTDWTKTQSYDNISHTEVGTKTPWIMLPLGEARQISMWHNVGDVATLYLKAEGPGLTPATVFEVDASTPYTITGQTQGDTGFLRIGVGNPGSSPLLTPDAQPDFVEDYQNLLRFTVKPKKQLRVVIHPICLATLDDNGVLQPGALPRYLPFRQDIENYLNAIFEVQANVHVTVELLPEVHVRWDVGMGAVVPDEMSLGAGNGVLDCYYSASADIDKISAEENSIFLSAPPDPAAGINLYYVVAPNHGRARGWLSREDEIASAMENLGSTGFFGWAQPALIGHRSKAVFVMDYAANGIDTPGVMWMMAHELGHGVGKLKHTCGAGLEYLHPNSMRGSDNESRLMTGRYGLKRALAPKQMIKYEWDQINENIREQ